LGDIADNNEDKVDANISGDCFHFKNAVMVWSKGMEKILIPHFSSFSIEGKDKFAKEMQLRQLKVGAN
jgi:hypothetical protein